MERISFLYLLCLPIILAFVRSQSLLGVHPLEEKYYSSEVIKCKDGSNSFTRHQLNDDFCDCVDGTDEPGTAACPAGKFYCRNVGSIPKFIFSSHVNDQICDCCDGSDEYDGRIQCPNTCIMGGIAQYKPKSHQSSITSRVGSFREIAIKSRVDSHEFVQQLKELQLLCILQVVFIWVLWKCGCCAGFTRQAVVRGILYQLTV